MPPATTPDAHAAQFTGQVALVTGGTQGVGAATARLLATRGAEAIAICGRNQIRGEQVAAELRTLGTESIFVATDLVDADACRQLVQRVDDSFGRLHLLANCAGITDRGTIWDTDADLWDRIFSVNARAPFLLMQGAARIMRRESISGAIVNVISMSSHGGQPFITAYCASKGALATLTRNVAFSLLPHRIRVNGLNIGWTDTPAEDHIQRTCHDADDSWLADAEARQPFGRLIKPDEVARAIAFLASAESGLMTGSIVDFDQSILGAYDATPHPEEIRNR